MQISRIKTPNISFSAANNNQRTYTSYSKKTILGQKEIEKLYEFAKNHKTENIAMEIFSTRLLDCKYVKTQTDLNNGTGKWLDITDYDENCY